MSDEQRAPFQDALFLDGESQDEAVAAAIASQRLTTSGSGWESNPPGVFSDATLGLKPRAVTRAAYTPEGSPGY
jgi:hypothetical protein